MRRRVFVVAGEYSANPRHLPPSRRGRAFLAEPHPEVSREEVTRLFFRYPNRSEDGRTKPEDWKREFGLESPIGLTDLFASAAHRAITSLWQLIGGDYPGARDAITDIYVTSMPGLDPNERMNIGLVPQALRASLALSPRVVAQYIVGTSDSGAWAFAQAVRAARTAEQPATILVVAGQIIPAGYASQYQIRTVLGEDDQRRGLDMLAVGDLLMDAIRRNLGLSHEEVSDFLTRVAARKFQAGAQYPAGIQAGKPFRRELARTPYFHASDIAAPCCGAAATIITSDEELARAVSAARLKRYRVAPITEVLGVGEGSSNENFLHRQSPIVFGTAVREALAATADDARVPLSAFVSCGFGVAHDAFPSIELSFLLAMGLSWERSAERMREGWSNPFGGLLSFGHALGASGLVQVNKAHHLFSGDERYMQDGSGPKRQGFRESGAVAYTTSVGGPLSHIVAGLLRGGFERLRPFAERAIVRAAQPDRSPAVDDWRARRHQLGIVTNAHVARLHGAGEPWLVEGTTYVSIRSALRALTAEEVSRLTFDGLEELVLPERLEEVRGQLRQVVLVVLGEAERVASMFDVFRLLTDEVHELAVGWREVGWLSSNGAALNDDKLAAKVKETLRVPFAVLCGTSNDPHTRRRVLFLPASGLGFADFDGVDVVWRLPDGRFQPASPDPMLLPFWNGRAARPERETPPQRPGFPTELVDQILAQKETESAAQLELLRLWFAADPPRPALEQALRRSGSAVAAPPPAVRAVVYLGEIAGRGEMEDPGAAHELVGRAVRDARAFLEAYETSVAQFGDRLAVGAFEQPPFRTRPDEGLVGAARFAREVARASFEHGVVVRAVVCCGEGAVYDDAAGHPGLASRATVRAAELLATIRQGPAVPTIAVDGAKNLLLERLQQRLAGWELDPDGPAGCAVWRLPK
jgi:hypothetical protein